MRELLVDFITSLMSRSRGPTERIYDGYPDLSLEMIDNRTFDGRIQLVEYRPRVLERPALDV